MARNQVFVEYDDGTCVVANGSTTERLRAKVNGRECDLPPRAFKAWTNDGKVCAEISEGADGKRHYFSDCPEFTYRDGKLKKKTELFTAASFPLAKIRDKGKGEKNTLLCFEGSL